MTDKPDARSVFERDQYDAASREVARQVVSTAKRVAEELTQVHLNEVLSRDPQAARAVMLYTAFLATGDVKSCTHLRRTPNAPAWWTSAFPWARWCGQLGCDQASIYALLATKGRLPTACVSCEQRAPRIGLKVACGDTVLHIHLCRRCQRT